MAIQGPNTGYFARPMRRRARAMGLGQNPLSQATPAARPLPNGQAGKPGMDVRTDPATPDAGDSIGATVGNEATWGKPLGSGQAGQANPNQEMTGALGTAATAMKPLVGDGAGAIPASTLAYMRPAAAGLGVLHGGAPMMAGGMYANPPAPPTSPDGAPIAIDGPDGWTRPATGAVDPNAWDMRDTTGHTFATFYGPQQQQIMQAYQGELASGDPARVAAAREAIRTAMDQMKASASSRGGGGEIPPPNLNRNGTAAGAFKDGGRVRKCANGGRVRKHGLGKPRGGAAEASPEVMAMANGGRAKGSASKTSNPWDDWQALRYNESMGPIEQLMMQASGGRPFYGTRRIDNYEDPSMYARESVANGGDDGGYRTQYTAVDPSLMGSVSPGTSAGGEIFFRGPNGRAYTRVPMVRTDNQSGITAWDLGQDYRTAQQFGISASEWGSWSPQERERMLRSINVQPDRMHGMGDMVYSPQDGWLTPVDTIRDPDARRNGLIDAGMALAVGGAAAYGIAGGAGAAGGAAGGSGGGMGMVAPGMEAQAALESQLLNQGILPGTAEWTAAGGGAIPMDPYGSGGGLSPEEAAGGDPFGGNGGISPEETGGNSSMFGENGGISPEEAASNPQVQNAARSAGQTVQQWLSNPNNLRLAGQLIGALAGGVGGGSGGGGSVPTIQDPSGGGGSGGGSTGSGGGAGGGPQVIDPSIDPLSYLAGIDANNWKASGAHDYIQRLMAEGDKAGSAAEQEAAAARAAADAEQNIAAAARRRRAMGISAGFKPGEGNMAEGDRLAELDASKIKDSATSAARLNEKQAGRQYRSAVGGLALNDAGQALQADSLNANVASTRARLAGDLQNSAADRDWRSQESAADRAWRTGESALDRDVRVQQINAGLRQQGIQNSRQQARDIGTAVGGAIDIAGKIPWDRVASWFSNGGRARKMGLNCAEGGRVEDPSNPNAGNPSPVDTIPAMLTDNEHVVNPEATELMDKLAPGFLDNLNAKGLAIRKARARGLGV